jgi:ribonuclease-3
VIAQRKGEELKAWVLRTFGYAFGDASLCEAALRHRSAGGEHNERLEFLGDAVLNLTASRLLYAAHPDADEGDLSRLRAAVVSGTTLAEIAGDVGLGEHLILGSGEIRSGGFRRASILADALEALFGAIYLDAGFEKAAAAIERVLSTRLNSLPPAATLKDPKTRLQEALQGQGFPPPVYALLEATGEPHAQTFHVRADIDTLQLTASGEGTSRRGAEQRAAARLLELLPPKIRRIS